jgi:methylated-DNA-[protein]-cysteine S-methyltransferase
VLIGTDFEKQVWEALCRIPYGDTRTYGDVARELDVQEGFRAVGRANGRNPVSIVVPCHRVVGPGGKLTGYGGGLWRKAHLLALESGQPTLPAAR